MTTPDDTPDTTPDLGPEHPEVQSLGTHGRALVLNVLSELADDGLTVDAKEAVLLLEAARTLDTCHRIEAELATSPLTVLGSMGQVRPSPLLDAADRNRRTLATLLSKVAAGNREAQSRDAARSHSRASVYSARIGGAA